MALDQSALVEVMDALKAAEVDDRIRQAAQTIDHAFIEAEVTAVIGAARARPHRPPQHLCQGAPGQGPPGAGPPATT